MGSLRDRHDVNQQITMPIWGGIEAGGTKVACAVATGLGDMRREILIPTTSPEDTIARIIDFFSSQNRRTQPLKAVGIGTFGPIDLNPHSHRFGYITTTPKAGWANTDFAGPIKRSLGVPVAFETDVNAAAVGEHRWGAAKSLDTFIYLTVGTGIGGGGMINGKIIHGFLHPEMGHMRIPHDFTSDPFNGSCPFHGDCLEGLASGVAIEDRWGRPSNNLEPSHPAWLLEAKYIAFGLANLIFSLCPQRIIMGGGVMQQPHLLPLIRDNVNEILGGYLKDTVVLNDIDNYIVPSVLGNKSGVLGAIALAQEISQ